MQNGTRAKRIKWYKKEKRKKENVLLLSKTAMVKWNASNKKHYESLGYEYTKIGDEFEVNIEDLQKRVKQYGFKQEVIN